MAQPRPEQQDRAPLAGHPVLRTDSFDEFHELVTAMSVPHERRQLERGRLSCRVNGARAGATSLHWIRYDRRMWLRAPADVRPYYLHLHTRESGRYDFVEERIPARPGRAVLLASGSVYELTSHDVDCLVLGIEPEPLERELALRGGPDPDSPARLARDLDLSGGAGRVVLELVAVLRAALEHGGGLLAHDAALRNFNNALIGAIAGAFLREDGATAETTGAAVAGRLARFAAYVAANLDQPITLGELCAASGLGARALQRACRARWGVSPTAYVTARRLDEAHRRFQLPRADDSVTGVALACGFFHLGRFAESYRKRFGEAPSRTLEKAKGRTP